MDKNLIDFSFRAPYYKLGEVGAKSHNIWVIFHGYGQLVEDFVAHFKEIDLDENILIFPQGLSKFYLKGVSNKIGTSWMTSHDRDLDISNYINYLNEIFDHEIKAHLPRLKLHLLGFSQGGHTVSRWISQSKIKYKRLILWGTSLAYEIGKQEIESSFSSGLNEVIIGSNDRFIDQQKLTKVKKRYEKIGFKYSLQEYEGGHDIYPEILCELL